MLQIPLRKLDQLKPQPTELDRFEVATTDELRAWQRDQLRWSLRHAYDNVPHYRAKFDAAGVHPDDLKTLDDLAKIALLYQEQGMHAGRQILNRQLTSDLLAARDAIRKDGDFSQTRVAPENTTDRTEFYKMGFHFVPYIGSKSRKRYDLPTMSGFGENEVTLYPNQVISIVMGNAAQFHPGDQIKSDKGPQTIRAIDRLSPF